MHAITWYWRLAGLVRRSQILSLRKPDAMYGMTWSGSGLGSGLGLGLARREVRGDLAHRDPLARAVVSLEPALDLV